MDRPTSVHWKCNKEVWPSKLLSLLPYTWRRMKWWLPLKLKHCCNKWLGHSSMLLLVIDLTSHLQLHDYHNTTTIHWTHTSNMQNTCWDISKAQRNPTWTMLKWNQVRCIPTWNWTFWLGIVLDHCAVYTCANDIMLTDGLIICCSIITNGWVMYHVMDTM